MKFFAKISVCFLLLVTVVCVAMAVYLGIGLGFGVRPSARVADGDNTAPILSLPPEIADMLAHNNAGAQSDDATDTQPNDPTLLDNPILPASPPYGNEKIAQEEIATPVTELPYYIAPNIPRKYTALLFFLIENAELYENFAAERPDLCMETIIWKVNVSVHVPHYSLIHVNEHPNPLLVSPVFRLPYGFVPRELVPVNNDNCQLLGLPEAVEAFRTMRATATQSGLTLMVVSAYRTAQRQRQNWENRNRRDYIVARPYHSEHQTGRAFDLGGQGVNGLLDQGLATPSPTGQWVAENAHLYGFIVRYLAETRHITGVIHEPWHITYVGTDISMYMYENGILSLEEFVGRNPSVEFTW